MGELGDVHQVRLGALRPTAAAVDRGRGPSDGRPWVAQRLIPINGCHAPVPQIDPPPPELIPWRGWYTFMHQPFRIVFFHFFLYSNVIRPIRILPSKLQIISHFHNLKRENKRPPETSSEGKVHDFFLSSGYCWELGKTGEKFFWGQPHIHTFTICMLQIGDGEKANKNSHKKEAAPPFESMNNR